MCQASICGFDNAASRYGDAKGGSISVRPSCKLFGNPWFSRPRSGRSFVLTVQYPSHTCQPLPCHTARAGSRYSSCLVIIAQIARTVLFARAMATSIRGLRQHLLEPGPFGRAVLDRPSDPRHRSDDRQPSDVPLPHLGSGGRPTIRISARPCRRSRRCADGSAIGGSVCCWSAGAC